jgi:hypothetical protein
VIRTVAVSNGAALSGRNLFSILRARGNCAEFCFWVGVTITALRKDALISREGKVRSGKLGIIADLIAASVMSLLIASSANAETVTFKAELKASNEVPPNSSAGTGTAEAVLDTETKTLKYTVQYSGMTGPAVGAHFHGPGEPGKNAGIVLPFKTVQSPIEGTANLTDAQIADLLAGKWYANVHTAANPGGELRGQMVR